MSSQLLYYGFCYVWETRVMIKLIELYPCNALAGKKTAHFIYHIYSHISFWTVSFWTVYLYHPVLPQHRTCRRIEVLLEVVSLYLGCSAVSVVPSYVVYFWYVCIIPPGTGAFCRLHVFHQGPHRHGGRSIYVQTLQRWHAILQGKLGNWWLPPCTLLQWLCILLVYTRSDIELWETLKSNFILEYLSPDARWRKVIAIFNRGSMAFLYLVTCLVHLGPSLPRSSSHISGCTRRKLTKLAGSSCRSSGRSRW